MLVLLKIIFMSYLTFEALSINEPCDDDNNNNNNNNNNNRHHHNDNNNIDNNK